MSQSPIVGAPTQTFAGPTQAGLVSAVAQTFAGPKSFVALDGTTAIGGYTNAGVFTLGPIAGGIIHTVYGSLLFSATAAQLTTPVAATLSNGEFRFNSGGADDASGRISAGGGSSVSVKASFDLYGGSSFATPRFRWWAGAADVGSISQTGVWTLGAAGSSAVNLIINGAMKPTGKVTSQSGLASNIVNAGTFDTLTAAQIPTLSCFILHVWTENTTSDYGVYFVHRPVSGQPFVRMVIQSGVSAGIGGSNQVQLTNVSNATKTWLWSALQIG